MTVFNAIARICSSMAELPALNRMDAGSSPAGCIALEREIDMRRVISLFAHPERFEDDPPIGLADAQREPDYFRHLMEYLRQRRAEAEQAGDVEHEESEALTCS